MAKKNKEPDKLAQDVSKAIAAGMSYGRWKAMQGSPKQPAIIRQPVAHSVCVQCKKGFAQYDNRQRKYCGLECKRAADYARKHKETSCDQNGGADQ